MPDEPYSRMSNWAVASAACGIASALGLVVSLLGWISVAGVGSACIALISVRRYELRGRILAKIGLLTSVFFGVATPIVPILAFLLEAPLDCHRLDFATFVGDNRATEDPFVGEHVCLKGYLALLNDSPTSGRVLFGSNGDELNGTGNWVMVELADSQTGKRDGKAVAVSGILEWNPRSKWNRNAPRYVLRNASLRPSRTQYQLSFRVTNGC